MRPVAGVDHALGVRDLDAARRCCCLAAARAPAPARRTALSRAHLRWPACRCAGPWNIGVADLAVGRPVGERDLGDQLRLDPALAAGGAPRPAAWCRRRRRRRAAWRPRASRAACFSVGRGLPRPSRCRRCRRSAAGRRRRARRAAGCRSRRARRRAVGVAADHELLALLALELEPGRRCAARRRARRRAWRSMPSSPMRARRLSRLDAASASKSALKRTCSRRRARRAAPASSCAPLAQRHGAQVVAVEVGQVEHEVVDRRRVRARVERVLQRVEVGRAVRRRARRSRRRARPTSRPSASSAGDQRRHLRRPVVAAARDTAAALPPSMRASRR